MKLVDLRVDRIIVSGNLPLREEIVMFKQDKGFFGLKAPRGAYTIGQLVPVLMSSDGESISWPPSAPRPHSLSA